MRTDTSFSSQNQCLCVWRSQQVSLSLFLPRVFSLCSSPFLSSPMLLLLSSGLSPIVHTLPGVPRAHKSFCIAAEQRCSVFVFLCPDMLLMGGGGLYTSRLLSITVEQVSQYLLNRKTYLCLFIPIYVNQTVAKNI